MRRKAVLQETGAVAALHLLFNLLLLVPVWVTGGRQAVPLLHPFLPAAKVQERHLTINPVIGSFPKEKKAYETVTLLSWLLPTIVVAGSLVDLGLATAYSLWAHPWAGILAEVGKGRCRDLREQEPAGPWGPQLLEPEAGGELPSQQVGAARGHRASQGRSCGPTTCCFNTGAADQEEEDREDGSEEVSDQSSLPSTLTPFYS